MDKIQELKAMDKHNLIKFLLKQHAHIASFRGEFINIVFLGQRLRFRIVRKHTGVVGNWDRKRNIIYFDETLGKKDIFPVLVHEAIEKFVTRKFKLHIDIESHEIAQAVEKHFIHNKMKWRKHEKRIWRIWKTKEKHRI